MPRACAAATDAPCEVRTARAGPRTLPNGRAPSSFFAAADAGTLRAMVTRSLETPARIPRLVLVLATLLTPVLAAAQVPAIDTLAFAPSADVFVDKAGLVYTTEFSVGLYILEFDG